MFIKILKYLRSEQGRKSLKLAIVKKIVNPFVRKFGYTVIADHFYQPIPNDKELLIYQNKERPLDSIEWKLNRQIELVSKLLKKYRDEFNNKNKIFYYGCADTNGFASGDAEFLYSIVREKKPKRIVEIGAGDSTQIIAAALKMNFFENSKKTSFFVIEPFPRDFLKKFEVNFHDFMDFSLIVKPIQFVDLSLFELLDENDILFIDSSHVFKQGSDVEFQFLKIYPMLNKGVIVHIHDIFFPFDYPVDWNIKKYQFWNEQYFLETFLQFNCKFEILASLSMVACRENLVFLNNINSYCKTRNPGSFWMVSTLKCNRKHRIKF
jgi:Methyltransferase domain